MKQLQGEFLDAADGSGFADGSDAGAGLFGCAGDGSADFGGVLDGFDGCFGCESGSDELRGGRDGHFGGLLGVAGGQVGAGGDEAGGGADGSGDDGGDWPDPLWLIQVE